MGFLRFMQAGNACSRAPGDPQEKLPKRDSLGASLQHWKAYPRIHDDTGPFMIRALRRTQISIEIGYKIRDSVTYNFQ